MKFNQSGKTRIGCVVILLVVVVFALLVMIAPTLSHHVAS